MFSIDLSNVDDEDFYKLEDLSAISTKGLETITVWEH